VYLLHHLLVAVVPSYPVHSLLSISQPDTGITATTNKHLYFNGCLMAAEPLQMSGTCFLKAGSNENPIINSAK